MKRAMLLTLFPLAGALAGVAGVRDETATLAQTAPVAPLSIDCTAASRACPEILIAGDAPAVLPGGRPSPARGYADASIRRDPATGTLWMAYSWPHAITDTGAGARPGVAVDSHLARSVDSGVTWTFVQRLWTSVPQRDGRGNTGHLNQETVSLAPRGTPEGTVWYSARHQYFTAGGSAPQVGSFVIRVATASSPDRLAQVDEAVLGGALTLPNWKPDNNLAALSPDLAGCTFFDPGLLFRDGALYLATQCALYTPQGEATEREFIAVFATVPAGDVRGWQWRYLGKLTTRADAVALGGENLLQTDPSLGRDGALLAIVSPSRPSGGVLAAHLGCRVLEVASLDPPQLARDPAGKPLVRASVTASDLMPQGPAACGYEPASSTGIVIVRRQQGRGMLVVSLHSTGLRP